LNNSLPPSLLLTFRPEGLSRFFPLLQTGVMVEAEVGSSVRDFLLTLPGVDSAYIDGRIKTVFLNGKVVDDVETAFLDDGSILALSAAMPGLAGAALRRGGGLASFRSQITFPAREKPGPRRKGFVLIKLYNLILKELGVIFLRRGIFLASAALAKFFKGQSEEFWVNLETALVNGAGKDAKELLQMNWAGLHETMELKVDFDI